MEQQRASAAERSSALRLAKMEVEDTHQQHTSAAMDPSAAGTSAAAPDARPTHAAPEPAPAAGPGPGSTQEKPTVILVIGMAGSGKTTLIQRLQSHLYTQRTPPYIINMDPAVTHVPYSPNIDIRDTVKYKNVMQQYGLGPNGGILTSCNLFATRFDQVLGLLERPRDPPLAHVLLDTPGQIEIFTWSASGQIVTELLASSFPTCVAFVMDTPRCAAPQTFMSNMLQAVSILYKTKLPMLLVFNKVDVTRHDFALEWMQDFESYHAALEADGTYAATLSRSLSLVLDEFYTSMKCVGVSALTGEGIDDMLRAVDQAAQEYHEYYVPELEARKKEKEAKQLRAQQKQMEAVRRDLAASQIHNSSADAANGAGAHQQQEEGSARPSAAGARQRGTQQVREGPQAGLGALAGLGARAMEEEHEDEGEEEGCSYEVSDDSIEDTEQEVARQESRAK